MSYFGLHKHKKLMELIGCCYFQKSRKITKIVEQKGKKHAIRSVFNNIMGGFTLFFFGKDKDYKSIVYFIGTMYGLGMVV